MRSFQFLDQYKAVTVDDVCPSNLKHWVYWLRVKEKYPDLKLIAFVIANFHFTENVAEDKEFFRWFRSNCDWVEIGVHGFDHLFPPEQERNDAEELVVHSLALLKPFLGDRVLYRPPGFQTSVRTEPMLRNLGFDGIAHQTRIKLFNGSFIAPIFNTHLTENKYVNPIGKVWGHL